MLLRDTGKYKTCPALEEWPVRLWELPSTGRSRHFRSRKVSQSRMLFVLWEGRLDVQGGSVVDHQNRLLQYSSKLFAGGWSYLQFLKAKNTCEAQ